MINCEVLYQEDLHKLEIEYTLCAWVCDDDELVNSKIHSEIQICNSQPDHFETFTDFKKFKRRVKIIEKQTTDHVFIKYTITDENGHEVIDSDYILSKYINKIKEFILIKLNNEGE